MGLGTLLAAALKEVSWQKIAGMAMEYGPDLYRTAREKLRREEPVAEASPVETELQERVDRLEKLLVEQEGVIREQVLRNEELAEACRRLDERLLRFRIATGVLAVVCLSLLALQFGRG